jgi:hypothetical protein
MRKLAEVEEAKALMLEARSWSVVKWLREKKRVRRAADKANEALDALEKEVKASWSPELKLAYDQLATPPDGLKLQNQETVPVNPGLSRLAQQVKQADVVAYRAHLDAEEVFDKAERILSTSMAREGTRKAIESWELHETAIAKAEAGVHSQVTSNK